MIQLIQTLFPFQQRDGKVGDESGLAYENFPFSWGSGCKNWSEKKEIYYVSTAFTIVNAASLLGKMEIMKYEVFCTHIDNGMLYSGFNTYLKISTVTWED